MGFLVSPGVEVKETDLTNIIPAVSTSVGAFAGFFRWGPVNNIVNISSETELARTFGAPSFKGEDDFEKSFLTASSYLQYSNTLRVVRADNNGSNSYSKHGFGTALTSPLKVNTIDELSSANTNDELETAAIRFVARYTGSLGDSIGVKVFDHNTSEIPAAFKAVATYKPGVTDWSKEKHDSLYNNVYGSEPIKDELTVVVYDRLGLITGNIGEILESYQGLSYFTGAKNDFNQSTYWADVLNNRSNYVWGVQWTNDPSGITAASYSDTNIDYLGTDETFELENGSDSLQSDYTAAAIQEALELFNDTETVDINFLFAHNFTSSANTQLVDEKLIAIAESRRDVIAFISAPIEVATLGSADSKKTALLEKFVNMPSTSYAVFDSSPVYVYNRYRDGFTWIPACGHIAGLCAKTDRLQDPWFSPAGFNRGNLLGVTKLGYNPSQMDRDDLYLARINPIISSPGNGIVLLGDKTALSKPGAFDRINVRRLFITIQKAISTASKFLMFELNDEFTRGAFRNSVEPYLRGVQGRRGIIDFKVICDESNNTPEVIDSNRFVGSILIKPTKSINFITLNFVAVRTGVSFEEVVGAA